MHRAPHLVAQIALVLAVAGCAAATDPTMWQCDVTLTTMDNRTVTGSGSGSTRFEASSAALADACTRLGLTGEARRNCVLGANPIISSNGEVIFIVDRTEDCEEVTWREHRSASPRSISGVGVVHVATAGPALPCPVHGG